MATKYIVNNVSGQTITGDITINGNLVVTGTSTSNDVGVYRALLTQTGSITGTALSDFNYGLIIGETYTIDTYVAGDDFSNIANVVSGNTNETGCEFIATGETPINYSNGSTLISNGGLIVDVLEDTLGFETYWVQTPFGGSGYYVMISEYTEMGLSNIFSRTKTDAKTQVTLPYGQFSYVNLQVSPISFMGKDNIMNLNVFDVDFRESIDDALYYTPVEIKLNKDLSPIIVNGTIESSYPINNLSMGFYCDGNNITTIYTDVDNIGNVTELIEALNNTLDFNILGTYSDDGNGGILLTMTTDTKNYFCQDGTLTFEIFND